MASNRIFKSKINSSASTQILSSTPAGIDDDDDFQDYPSSCFASSSRSNSLNSTIVRPSKKQKKQRPINPGKENWVFSDAETDLGGCELDSIEPTFDWLNPARVSGNLYSNDSENLEFFNRCGEEEEENAYGEEFYEEGSTQLDELLKLCAEMNDSKDGSNVESGVSIACPLCGADISGLSDEMRQIHTNQCLDKMQDSTQVAPCDDEMGPYQCPGQVVDGSPTKAVRKVANFSPVVEWLQKLGLAKYEENFVKQEIDWVVLQSLTEEDLCSIGITALGPRKKILNALKELQNNFTMISEPKTDGSKGSADNSRLGTNKLITDYFSDPHSRRTGGGSITNIQNHVKNNAISTAKKVARKDCCRNGKQKDVPLWCRIPGTPFRVDAFKYLRRDCSHWFLTHFHLDHYQGLTRSFCHGMIYCSTITAKLINLKIGIPSDIIQVLPLNQKINIAGIGVTCFDANHCPGAIIILFELPTGKNILHTGDFRFCEEMKELPILQTHPIHSLILDTTYCNPQIKSVTRYPSIPRIKNFKFIPEDVMDPFVVCIPLPKDSKSLISSIEEYDFPKQDAIIQFVIEAIQAEAFNQKTLFLIGSYTIGKERVFIEVAKALRKKVYVTAAKLRLLECLGLPQEDMQWFTLKEHESHIHVVPMWSIASFKRLKHMSNQYMGRYNLIVAFSPTGWSMGKGKKSTGRRWQQGTIIRYEVPYSEHSSFTELKEFVKFISPDNIIPSVNNHSPDAHHSMVSQLLA